MIDLSDKGSSESEDMSSQSSQTSQISTIARASSGTQQIKTCVDCGTSKTPLWRGGPAGPKSLCNACGIKSRKKRRALLGLNKDDNKTKKTSKTIDVKEKNSTSTTTSSNDDESNLIRYGGSLKKSKYFGFGSQVVALKQRPRSPRSNTTQRKKVGEEERQAAFLLMALSCGSVY